MSGLSAAGRRSSPKRSPRSRRRRSNLFAITSTSSELYIGIDALKSKRVLPRAAQQDRPSLQWDRLHVRLLDPTGRLLREHLHQARRRHRIKDDARPERSPLGTVQLLERAPTAGPHIGQFSQTLYERKRKPQCHEFRAFCPSSRSFVDAADRSVPSYSGLKVWNADGTALPVRFEPSGDRLLLAVEETGARYPLTIDPVAQQAYLKASNTGNNDQFGSRMAIRRTKSFQSGARL